MRLLLTTAASFAVLWGCATPHVAETDAAEDPVPMGFGVEPEGRADGARAAERRDPVPLALGEPNSCASVRARAAAMLATGEAELARLLAEPDQLTRQIPAIGACRRVPEAAVAPAVDAWVRSLGDAEAAGLRVGCAEGGAVLVEAHARRPADESTYSVVGHARGTILTPLVSGALRGREGRRVEARGVADLDGDRRADVLIIEWALGASGPARPTTTLVLATGARVDASMIRTNVFAHFIDAQGGAAFLTGERGGELVVFFYRVKDGELEPVTELEEDLGSRISSLSWDVERLRELATRPDDPEQPHFEGADLLSPLSAPEKRCLAARLTLEEYDFQVDVRRPHQDDDVPGP